MQMEETCLRERPKLIIGGASAYSREWDYARMRAVADRIGAIFMVDMAHPAGLIAAGLLENPAALRPHRNLHHPQDPPRTTRRHNSHG